MSCGAAPTPFYADLIASHARRYPRWRAEDVYKLLHQSFFGSEHAVPDADSARRWLEQEIQSMADGPAEPVIDPITARGELARVHLRPYLSSGRDPEDLLEAVLQTAAGLRRNPGDFADEVGSGVALAVDRLLRQSGGTFQGFLQTLEPAGFPPIHHSDEFVRAYRPAYRVVAVRFLSDRIIPD